jgi:hypothetical protein
MSFLHGITGSKELKKAIELTLDPATRKYDIPKSLFFESIIRVDPNICMFDKDGKAFILDSLEKYMHITENNLLNMIPFYYFLQTYYKPRNLQKKREKNYRVFGAD